MYVTLHPVMGNLFKFNAPEVIRFRESKRKENICMIDVYRPENNTFDEKIPVGKKHL